MTSMCASVAHLNATTDFIGVVLYFWIFLIVLEYETLLVEPPERSHSRYISIDVSMDIE